jgi:hypothetical protein
VGKTLTWKALEIVEFDNASYCHTIVIQGFPRFFLKAWLKFELGCQKYCIMADDSLNSLDDIET